MLYQIFGNLIKLGTRQFFKEIHLTGAPTVENGPVIIAANHPNQAVDPFLMGTIYNRPLYFLAKSTLFKNPVLNAFFRSLHMIPVYRKQDSSDTALNEGMFKAASDALTNGHGIVIFPEGTSTEERRLLPLKTGAARLALQTVTDPRAAHLVIQPVGITYLAPRTFQSSVSITIGTPIPVSTYTELYRTNPQTAVKQLTEEIEEALRPLTVEIKQLEHQTLIEQITILFEEKGNMTERMQMIARQVEEIAPHFPELKDDIERKLTFYCQMRLLFPSSAYAKEKSLKFYLLAPLVLIGGVVNFPPYKMIAWYMRRYDGDPHNLASLKIGIGLLTYIGWYICISLCITIASHSLVNGLGTLVILILLGLATNRFIEQIWSLFTAVFWVGPSPLRFLETYGGALRQELLDLYAKKTGKN